LKKWCCKMIKEKDFEALFEEVQKVRQLLEILARDALKRELEEYATTVQRRRIWALCNGLLSTEEIAKRVGVTPRAVQIFLEELRKADLVTFIKRGRPRRRFDFIPSEWKIKME